MRPDMAKVIVERPRLGGDGGKHRPRKGTQKAHQKTVKNDWDDTQQRQSMAPGRQFNDPKNLNEHLSPLRRYLFKQVGRPWDKVFSEICENISLDSAVQSHVRDHVFDYIILNTTLVDGIAHFNSTYSGLIPITEGFAPLYVCPKSGIIKKVKNKKNQRYRFKPQPKLGIEKDKNRRWIRINKVWYEIILAKIPPAKYVVDLVLRQTIGPHGAIDGRTHDQFYDEERGKENRLYAASKIQLSKAKIKQYGLNEHNEKHHANLTITLTEDRKGWDVQRGIAEDEE